MATFQVQSFTRSLAVCASVLFVTGAAPATASSLLTTSGRSVASTAARSMLVPVCEPNCLGAPYSTDSNTRPEDVPYTGPQTEGSPNSTYNNAAPPDESDVAGSPSSTYDNPVPPQDAAGAGGDGLFAEPAAPPPFDPYEALRSATPK